jgi:hypothetical protein
MPFVKRLLCRAADGPVSVGRCPSRAGEIVGLWRSGRRPVGVYADFRVLRTPKIAHRYGLQVIEVKRRQLPQRGTGRRCCYREKSEAKKVVAEPEGSCRSGSMSHQDLTN